MFAAIKDWFSDVKASVRAHLKKIPPMEVLWKERRAYLAALRVLGDKVEALEPEQIARLDYVRLAVRAAQFAAGKKMPGLGKLAEVELAVRAAWAAAGIADDVFDRWWVEKARPFIDAYVGEVKAADAWIPPA